MSTIVANSTYLLSDSIDQQGSSQSIERLASGGFVLTYADNGLYSKIFDANGQQVGAPTLISATVGQQGYDGQSSIVALANGNYAVSWVESNRVHVQVFAGDGTALSANQTVSPQILYYINSPPQLTALANG